MEIFQSKLDILDEAVRGLGSAKMARHCQIVRAACLLGQDDRVFLRSGSPLWSRNLTMLDGVQEVFLERMCSGGKQAPFLFHTTHINNCTTIPLSYL